MEFVDLSMELKMNILQYLTDDLRRTFSTVSKRWKDLCRAPSFRKKLYLTGQTHSSKVAVQFLTKYYRANFVTVINFQALKWLYELPRRPYLRKILFIRCTFESADVISYIVHCFPSIREIQFSHCEGVDDNCLKEVAGWKLLDTMAVIHCVAGVEENYVVDDGCERIAVNCKNLRAFALVGYHQITESSCIALLNLRGENLRFLWLNCEDLTDTSYQALRRCRNLVALSLKFARRMTSLGLQHLKELNRLTYLHLEDAEILSSADFVDFFNNGKLCNLRCVSLNWCVNLADECLNSLTKRNPLLFDVRISHCANISEDGIQTIANNLRNLRYLQLYGLNHISEEFLKQAFKLSTKFKIVM